MGSKHPTGEPDPADDEPVFELVAELIDDDAVLPGDSPRIAAADRETIGADGRRPWHIRRLPRGLRIAGALAAVAALTVVAWPTPRVHHPTPIPSPQPTHVAVNADLAKVSITGTTLTSDAGAGSAVLGLELANGAASQLDIVTADVFDGSGARIGTTSAWPPGTIAAGSALSLPMTLPFTCDSIPVLPITIRYSVGSPQDTNIRHIYVSPLAGHTWDVFSHEQAAHCASATDNVYVASVDTTQRPHTVSTGPGFDLTFTFDSLGEVPWSVDGIISQSPEITVTSTDTPLTVAPGRSGTATIHVHFPSCTAPRTWTADWGLLRFTARAAAAGTPATSDQPFMKIMRPTLFSAMVQKVCSA
ncbi:hypothetical protein [Catenulispora rubra]|uniref:hypothetical protein n=1 Tax=Catenulispora rubra TaxID=280293 RepID=UPI0018922943|nr:hypothetical protein [Catenulispora rubra]